MSGSDTCSSALRAGRTPVEIASAQGLSLSSVLGHLDRAVGENKIARSEIYFSLPRQVRAKVEDAARHRGYAPMPGQTLPRIQPIVDLVVGEDPALVQVALRYGPASRYYGDLYELVRRFELGLHGLIKDVLVKKFGLGERAWWYEGVPVSIRKSCAESAEDLGRFDVDPWSCTYMLDLQAVMKAQWLLFEPLYRVGGKNEVLSEIKDVNGVRNRVMHPVRDAPPTNDDFDVLENAYARLLDVRARFYGTDET